MLHTRKVVQGSASNIARLLLSVLVATVLPPVLVHHLSHEQYSAWVLILQLSTYVNLLDLGLQTVISKLVAEYHAKEDLDANHRLLSSSFSMLLAAGMVGVGVVSVLAWRVPEMFRQMPAAELPQVRLSLLVIGFVAAFALPFNPFLSAFTGLQEYGFPTVLALVSRASSAAALIIVVLLHGSLLQMAVALAATNLAAALAQYWGWYRYARERVPFSFFYLDKKIALEIARSSGVLAIWVLGGLFVSGLDVVIVGHYDYANTGFYAVAATATNFTVLLVSAVFSPLLPAVSSMQTASSASALGQVTLRFSRYCALFLVALGTPLLIGAYPILSLWVGHDYAVRSAPLLRVLIVGNIVRQLGYPYSLVVIATGKQHLATLASVAEAIVNLALSVWLASRIGARGVAIGTVVGAFVSLGLHMAISMRRTRATIDLSPYRFAFHSMLRPLACTAPLLLLLPSWNGESVWPARPAWLALAVILSGLLLYGFGLTAEDRGAFWRRVTYLRSSPSA